MWTRRALEIAGDLVAGDGLATVLAPRGHLRLWQDALPWAWWRDLTQAGIERPAAMRAIGGAQIVLGALLMGKAIGARREARGTRQ